MCPRSSKLKVANLPWENSSGMYNLESCLVECHLFALLLDALKVKKRELYIVTHDV